MRLTRVVLITSASVALRAAPHPRGEGDSGGVARLRPPSPAAPPPSRRSAPAGGVARARRTRAHAPVHRRSHWSVQGTTRQFPRGIPGSEYLDTLTCSSPFCLASLLVFAPSHCTSCLATRPCSDPNGLAGLLRSSARCRTPPCNRCCPPPCPARRGPRTPLAPSPCRPYCAPSTHPQCGTEQVGATGAAFGEDPQIWARVGRTATLREAGSSGARYSAGRERSVAGAGVGVRLLACSMGPIALSLIRWLDRRISP